MGKNKIKNKEKLIIIIFYQLKIKYYVFCFLVFKEFYKEFYI